MSSQDAMVISAVGYNTERCFPMNASGIKIGDRVIHQGGLVETVESLIDINGEPGLLLRGPEHARQAMLVYIKHLAGVGILRIERRRRRVRLEEQA